MKSTSAETCVSRRMRGLLSCLSDGLAPASVDIRELDCFSADPQYLIPAFDDFSLTSVVHAARVTQNRDARAGVLRIFHVPDVLQWNARRWRRTDRLCRLRGRSRLLLLSYHGRRRRGRRWRRLRFEPERIPRPLFGFGSLNLERFEIHFSYRDLRS